MGNIITPDISSRIIAPCHDNRWSDAGVQRLLDNPLLPIANCPSPFDRRIGGGAGGVDWDAEGYGSAIPYVSGTAPDYDQTGPFFGSKDLFLKSNAGGYYQETAVGPANITTEDFAIEAWIAPVVQAGGAFPYFYGTRQPTGGAGWMAYLSGSDIYGYANGAGGSGDTFSYTFTPGSYLHLLWVYDASGNSICYINSVATGAAVDVSGFGSLSSAGYLYAGGAPGTNRVPTNKIGYLAGYKLATWFSSHDQQAAASERFALLTGAKAHKSWNGVTLPTTNTCDAATFLYKVESGVTKLHKVGKDHLKICSKAISGVGNVKFALVEGAAENLLTRSNTIEDWSSNQCTDTADAATAPNGLVEYCQIVENANNDAHVQYKNLGALDQNDYIDIALYCKKGDRDYFLLEVDNWNGTLAGMVINVATGALADSSTDDAGVLEIIGTPIVEDVGDGNVRALLRLRAVSAVGADRAAHYVYAGICSTALRTGRAFIGDPVTYPAGVFAWGAQAIKNGTGYFSSLIETVASAVTRPVCTLKEDITGLLGGTFSIRGSFVAPTFTPAAKHVVCHLAADASNYIQIYIDTDRTLKAATAIGSGDAGAAACAGSVCEDDKLIRFQLSGQAGKLLLQYRMNDDTVSTIDIDTSVDIPLALTELSIGHDATPAYHFAPCGLCDLQISRLFSASLSEPFSGHSVLDLS